MPDAPHAWTGEERRAANRPKVDGHRATDPTLTTGDIARRVGLKESDVILGEILEGRLLATIIRIPGRRAIYRISEADFQAWRRLYVWKGDPQPAPVSDRPA